MKTIKKIELGKGKLVIYQSNNNQFTLKFEYKEDKNNLIFISKFGSVLEDMLNNISITDQREDAVQFCFQLSDNVWKYCEYNYVDRSLIEDTIDISKLSNKDKEEAIQGFYSSLDEVNEIYGKDYNQIIAECYFENQIY
jgi:hypothetical protein